ncbi:Hsp33 family molecular chaperone HslO [Sporosarcina aquimarina]|uniref:33 kDa chaperonin n=1 Tax=Sporosarcina aquimarina TaxID=114975 RepID=A0ABU4G4T1_9BACL|nr:Hsp33 family molecular chaperone HslO [Sporosarcina aquimarina]MDW0111338.1 Hsp33 family molecular chaperone HslO [Sporosarcina aquimarina]
MKDYLIKALAFDGTIRAYASTTTASVGEMQRRHNSWPTATAAVGRTMTATVMMGAMMKGEDKLTVKLDGGGPLGAIITDADANGHIRGYAIHPQTHFDLNEQGKLDVRRAVGTEGLLTVVKDLGLRDMFTGQTPIVSGEVAEDFTQYFVVSEQVPSAVALGVLVNPDNTVKASGGFILQVMPGATDETISELEQRISQMEPISKMIDRGLSPQGVLEEVLGLENVRVVDEVDVSFRCNCSKERFGTAIKSLGETEIQTIIQEDGEAEAECHFCLEKYVFSKDELEEFVDEIRSGS